MSTVVFSADNNTPSRMAQVDDVVYSLNNDMQYKHTAHRIRRIDVHGLAVTYCTIWLYNGAVNSEQTDCMVWCENGCKPTTLQETN